MKTLRVSALIAAATLCLAACSDDTPAPGAEPDAAAPDATPDAAETGSEPDTEPDPGPEPEPEADAAPEPEPDAAPEPEPDAAPEPDGAPEPEPEPDAAPEPEPDAAPEPEPDTDPEPDPAPDAGPDPAPEILDAADAGDVGPEIIDPCSDLECDDGNPCTDDSCEPEVGCVYVFNTAPCDDGQSCTEGDACVAGACIGAKTDACLACQLPFGDVAQKLVGLTLSGDGQPGSGLDVDDDPDTCSPADDCGGGVDNTLSILSGLVNDAVTDALVAGDLAYVVDLNAFVTEGEAFPMAVYDASLASSNLDCLIQLEVCTWTADQVSFDGACEPYFAFDDAVIEGALLTAGGPDSSITMILPLTNGVKLPLSVARGRLVADITWNADNPQVIDSLSGLIGGAVIKQQLLDTILALDGSLLPVDKDAIVQLLDDFIVADIDLDGDGTAEAVSIGMTFTTLPGIMVAD